MTDQEITPGSYWQRKTVALNKQRVEQAAQGYVWLDGAYGPIKTPEFLRDYEPVTSPTLAELMGWLASRSMGYGTGWLCRMSRTGRGVRLMETSEPGGFPTPEAALRDAWERAKEEVKP